MEVLDDQLVNSDLPEQYTLKEVFLKIWTEPRKVFTSLHLHKENKHVFMLIMVAAVVGLLENFNKSLAMPDGYSTMMMVIMFLSVALAYVVSYLVSALLKWTGSWLGGKAETKDVLRVTAYASIPSIARTIIIVPLLLFYLVTDSSINFFQTDSGENYVNYALLALAFIIGVWQIVMFVVGLSVAHQFGIGSAVLSLVFAVLVLFIPFVVIALVFAGSLI